jgi:replicative DNA helicase
LKFVGTKKDPNDALVVNKEDFTEIIKSIESNAWVLLKEKLETGRKEYEEEHFNGLTEALSYFEKERKAIPTEFDNLDKFLDGGLYTRLYIIGATSGAGKTTFVLQIADSIAKSGNDVLFFSIEMARYEIITKSLSRISRTTNPDDTNSALTARKIMTIKKISQHSPHYMEVLAKTVSFYKETIYPQMYICNGRPSIDTIKNTIEKHLKFTSKNPTIFIDYLQIIQTAETRELRHEIDRNLSELRIVSAQYENPIFVISSLNRGAYDSKTQQKNNYEAEEKEIGLSAFFESGSIEYSSDVLMTLRTQKSSENKDKKTVIMELNVLKNRMGRRHRKTDERLYFEFHYCFNYFQEIQCNKIANDTIGSDNSKNEFVGGGILE